jgi:hypothetical protein
MQNIWVLSKFFRDENNILLPAANAYGNAWRCPRYPDTDEGFALVQLSADLHQLEAAKSDDWVVVIPNMYSPLPQQVVDAYSGIGATDGMTLAQLLDVLTAIEPLFGISS